MPDEPAIAAVRQRLAAQGVHPFSLPLAIDVAVLHRKDGATFSVLGDWHGRAGYLIIGLVIFRIVWGFVGTHYARFAQFSFGPRAVLRYLGALAGGRPEHHVGHNPAGSWAIWAILGLGAATGITGYMTFNELGGESLEELHEAFANAWLVVVFVHVAGVIVSSHESDVVRGERVSHFGEPAWRGDV